MDKDFEKKVKGKRLRKIALVIIGIVILAGVITSLKFTKNDGSNGGTMDGNYITMEIQCDQLVKNMDALNDKALTEYIPENGKILPPQKVKLEKGDNVFTVTERVCKEKNIQMESSYTPGYGSHYIEGINYLYEFSAGKYSGWMFKINGEVPQYGADKCELKKGDKLVWFYTVNYKEDGM